MAMEGDFLCYHQSLHFFPSAGLKSAISSRSLTRGCQFRIDRNLTDLTAPRGTAYAWWGRGSAARGRKKGS